MRKIIFIFLMITLLIFSNISALAATSSYFDFNNLENGMISVNYGSDSGKQVKLMIQNDSQNYFYDLSANGSVESFTLQMGSGKYTFSILENTSGHSYRYISKKYAYVELLNENIVF